MNIKVKPGVRFGRLVAVSRTRQTTHTSKPRWIWQFKCDCGETIEREAALVLSGHTVSCGCYNAQRRTESRTHGEAHHKNHTPEYRTWASMLARSKPRDTKTCRDYGGKGIGVCPQWEHSFEQFLKDMGRKPSPRHSIDRIDNSKGYSPENCRWATPQEQSRNKKNNIHLTFLGKTQLACEWAEELGINRKTIYDRLKYGWTTEQVLTRPPK